MVCAVFQVPIFKFSEYPSAVNMSIREKKSTIIITYLKKLRTANSPNQSKLKCIFPGLPDTFKTIGRPHGIHSHFPVNLLSHQKRFAASPLYLGSPVPGIGSDLREE